MKINQQFADLIDARLFPTGFDMAGTVDFDEFLVFRAGGLGKSLLGHVKRVGVAARNHQERFVNQIGVVSGIKRHQIQQAAHGAARRAVGVVIGDAVILETLLV